MTRVCLVGKEDIQLRYELLSRQTSREALRTYDLHAPYENSIGIETVSLGAAISLLNDLNWYLVRFVADALILEPSVTEEEWLSRELAHGIRDGAVKPAETGRLLKVYGVERPKEDERLRLVEPMYLVRTDGTVPTYDIRDVDGTVLVRVTENEFEQG